MKRKTMEDEEYAKVKNGFDKFKRTRTGRGVIRELDYILFKFYLEGYILNSHKHSKTKRGKK